MSPEWLIESGKAGYFVEESSFGSKATKDPIKNKNFSFVSSFVSTERQKVVIVRTLLKLGKAKELPFPASSVSAPPPDYVIYADNEAPPSLTAPSEALPFNMFLQMLQEKPAKKRKGAPSGFL